MHHTSSALVALFALSSALAQTLPPSPTASVGCEPHGDHWHCDGPATVTSSGVLPPSPTASVGCEPHGDHWHCDGPVAATTSAAASSSSHEDHEESGTLPPSPTESVGCEPHGDHWHCDGPASTTSAAAATETTHDHDHEDDHSASTGTLPPSPTASVGCEPHGDHWHCDGPRVTLSSTTAASASASVSATTSPIPTAGVGKLLTNGAALVGGLVLALGM